VKKFIFVKSNPFLHLTSVFKQQ